MDAKVTISLGIRLYQDRTTDLMGGARVAREKVVLAYSGGLDTSVAVKWIDETYGMDVVAYTCDLGQGQDIEAIRQKALKTGAIEAIAEDVRNLFVDFFAFPSL